MAGDRRGRKERPPPHIERPEKHKPQASSSAAVAFKQAYKPESMWYTDHREAIEAGVDDAYRRQRAASYMPHGGSMAYNHTAAPGYIPSHAMPPAMNFTHHPPQFTGGHYTGQNAWGYRVDTPAWTGAPTAYPTEFHRTQHYPAQHVPAPRVPEPYVPARWSRPSRNANPFLQAPYAPPRPNEHFQPNRLGIRTEDLVYRRGQFDHDVAADFELSRRPPVARQNVPRGAFAAVQTDEPPLNHKRTPAGHYSPLSTQSSISVPSAKETRPRRTATEEDARLHNIPTNYNRDLWNPDEDPITFLETVFDTDSLGKWIFQWANWSYTGRTPSSRNGTVGCPMSDIAGDLWLLLLQLTGNLKLSKEFIQRSTGGGSRNVEDYDMVSDFIEAGTRLMERLQLLLRKCEKPVLEALDADEGALLGQLLVDIIFDREDGLPQIEKLVQSIRLWNLRWDTNCADVVKEGRAG